MNLTLLTPRKSLNKAFLKIKPNRNDIERFKNNFIKLIDRINEAESEEFHKNLISEFLKDTYYKENYFINTKGRNDLVIHNGKDAKSTVGVIVEAKQPTDKTGMLRTDNINAKALQELALYYLRERITQKNLEIKYLIATNIYEWFIFDAQLFERLFANNKPLIKKFTDFEEKRLPDTRTDFFYKEIAEPFIKGIEAEIVFTHFDIRDYKKPLRNADKQDDNKLIALYKLLSPEHLLKLPFANDSNSLDKSFYTELLHIIGLVETKEGGKKLIGRKKEGERNSGSLMESVIIQLESLDKISRLEKPHRFGETNKERLFNVALELSITWINRILFLKLLEAQLIKYNKGDKSYSFLNLKRVRNFDDLNSLFFQVLARKQEERNEQTKKLFAKVPYLNSSLFEPTEIEHNGLFISQLRDTQLPILGSTVLKDQTGKKRTGALDTLEYIVEFLDAYDFASEGSEEIQEDNKTLINASVLGLIFEKINGYKDGSFFTPGFITMYMCRETIRRAVVQKFNDAKKWYCQDINQLYDKIEDKKEANAIINSVKICDPAVGSGHFLVSALNEIIAIKNDLKILSDRDGKRLKEYSVEVISDELIVTDEDGQTFEYNPQNKESQRLQETLFHEKQTIIENCLFGVDINPNSVKICRLRLWIELLKNAYYKAPDFVELETLPNIDINIKCGNSLISRYPLDADIKEALRHSKWSIDSYRLAVMTYRNAQNKSQKQAMEKLIAEIKSNFEIEVAAGDKRVIRLKNLKDELKTHATQTQMFELTKTEKVAWETKLKKLTAEITKLEATLEEIKNNKIYENAFEWRFEFPEVLNDDGDFVGFDVVIGNPPYIRVQELDYSAIDYYKSNFQVAFKRVDISILFIELSKIILKSAGLATYITSNQFLTTEYGYAIRKFLKTDYRIMEIIDFGDLPVFEEALTYVSIFAFKKDVPNNFQYYNVLNLQTARFLSKYPTKEIEITHLDRDNWVLSTDGGISIINKLKKYETLETIGKSWAGLFTGLDKILMFNENEIESLEFEKEAVLPVIRANDCSKFVGVTPSKYVIYPYKLENNKTVLLKEEELKKLYPKVYQYLLNNKAELSKRKDSRKVLGDAKEWYKLTRFGQKNIFSEIKIVSPGEVKEHKFCIDYSKAGFSCARVFAITLSDETVNIKFLLSLLNSNLIKYYIQSHASLKAGGYYTYSSNILNQIPIKKISVNEQKPFIELINQILAAKKQNPAADTSALEKEIDQLVYQLYGLTEEEIQIVEQN